MGMEFKDETVSGGLRIVRRTIACDVCHTVFLEGWPVRTTTCHECGAPLCDGCESGHACPDPQQRLRVAERQRQFYERMNPRGGR